MNSHCQAIHKTRPRRLSLTRHSTSSSFFTRAASFTRSPQWLYQFPHVVQRECHQDLAVNLVFCDRIQLIVSKKRQTVHLNTNLQTPHDTLRIHWRPATGTLRLTTSGGDRKTCYDQKRFYSDEHVLSVHWLTMPRNCRCTSASM